MLHHLRCHSNNVLAILVVVEADSNQVTQCNEHDSKQDDSLVVIQVSFESQHGLEKRTKEVDRVKFVRSLQVSDLDASRRALTVDVDYCLL